MASRAGLFVRLLVFLFMGSFVSWCWWAVCLDVLFCLDLYCSVWFGLPGLFGCFDGVSARLPSSGPGHHPWTTRGPYPYQQATNSRNVANSPKLVILKTQKMR